MPLSSRDRRVARRLAAQADPAVVGNPRDPFYHLEESPPAINEFRQTCFSTKRGMEKVLADLEEVRVARRQARETRDPAQLVYARILLRDRAAVLQKTGRLLEFPGLVVLGKELLAIADKLTQEDRERLKDVLKPKSP